MLPRPNASFNVPVSNILRHGGSFSNIEKTTDAEGYFTGTRAGNVIRAYTVIS